MTYSILMVGVDPDLVDFTAPGIPPGLDAAKVKAGIELAKRAMTDRGWRCDSCPVDLGETAAQVLGAALDAHSYDCVVIGAGVRAAPYYLLLETLINTVRRHAPHTPIAFNTRPDDSADAAARWLKD